MSKLARKFLFSISAVLVVVIAFSLLVNSGFVERYYLHVKKSIVDDICRDMLARPGEREQIIAAAEQSAGIVIVVVENTDDNTEINYKLRDAFLERGLGLERYWLWDQDYDAAIRDGTKLRIYDQGRLNYSLLVQYVDLGTEFAGVAMIIPNVGEMIALINRVTVLLFGFAVVLIIFLLYVLIRRITTPLSQLVTLTRDIANQNFHQIEICTGDELEDLAYSINQMSEKLRQAQSELLQKNQQMEDLLSNVSHELKTPIALIKAYASGIRDDMDDGTFLDTLICQNERMEQIVERLLGLSRTQNKQTPIEPVVLVDLIRCIIAEQEVSLREKGIHLEADLSVSGKISANKDAVNSIISNLITNAIKYTEDGNILIALDDQDNRYRFRISNGISRNNTIDTYRLWEPFYVGEESRSKELSGTGLGLSIVRAIAEKYDYQCECAKTDSCIAFTILF